MHVQVDDLPKKQGKSKRKNKILLVSIIGFIICMSAGAYLLLFPSAPDPNQVTTPTELPHYQLTLAYDFGILPSAYDQHIIKIEHLGGDSIENMSEQLWVTIYPPDSTPYLKRSPVFQTSKYLTFEKGDVLYVYIGKDQNFYASKELPSYSDFIDFPNGNWGIHIDDARYKSAISSYSFTVSNSKTHIIDKKNEKSINQMMNDAQPYDTIFIVGDQIYHEQVLMDGKSIRLYGMNGPIIDAGGINSAITISNCSFGEIAGFDIRSSGTANSYESGIYLKNSDHISIRNNSIHDNQNGIYLISSNENDIRFNMIQVNDIAGLSITYGSSKNTIKSNYFGLNTIGIFVRDSSDNNYIVLNNGSGNSRYGILIENKLKNMYEYNNFTTDRMSYNKVAEDKIISYSQDKTNASDWLAPDRTIGLHESV